jgi:hypothetical protein
VWVKALSSSPSTAKKPNAFSRIEIEGPSCQSKRQDEAQSVGTKNSSSQIVWTSRNKHEFYESRTSAPKKASKGLEFCRLKPTTRKQEGDLIVKIIT